MRHVMGVTASEPGTATEKAGSDSETKARYSRRIGHSLALLKSTSTDNAERLWNRRICSDYCSDQCLCSLIFRLFHLWDRRSRAKECGSIPVAR